MWKCRFCFTASVPLGRCPPVGSLDTIPAGIDDEEVFKASEIPRLRCGTERFDKSLIIRRAYWFASLGEEALAGSADDLAGVDLAELKIGGDLTVGVVERHTKNEGRSFQGGELLEQQA